MAYQGVNLDEVEKFLDSMGQVRKSINSDDDFMHDLINQGPRYDKVKEYIISFARLLQYSTEAELKSIYRVRRLESSIPFTDRKNILYPEPSTSQKDRMNNQGFRVLYVSFHEFTAMAETRIDSDFIGKYFQLTRFKAEQPLKVYKLGLFSDLFLNSPRNSKSVLDKQKELLGEPSDSAIRGFSALENAFANILYSKEENSHILSSIVADSIFTVNEGIDAIMYPSMQNQFGMNLAIRQSVADRLNVTYTSMNELKNVYSNGYFKFHTIEECLVTDTDTYTFDEIDCIAQYH